jgi:glycosyltransferase involved in cell wall biosynthesis
VNCANGASSLEFTDGATMRRALEGRGEPLRKRIVIVHPNTDLYGSDRMLLRSLLALRDAGAEVELHVPAPGAFTDRLRELGIAWHRTEFPVLRRTLASPAGVLRLARQLVISLPAVVRALRAADVLYVNTINCGIWLLVAKALGVPAICHVRENEAQMGRTQRMLLLAPLLAATKILTNSRSTQDWVVGALPRLGGRTKVLYNGLDLPDAPYARPFEHSSGLRLVVVGRLSWRKGQDVAIRALADLRKSGIDATLTLVGDHYPGYEAYVEGLHELASKLEVDGVVDFAGFHSELEPFWANTDIALVPSLLEPFGNVAVEAMAAGVPVVASDVQGLAEIIDDGATGRLVPAGDASALATVIRQLASDSNTAQAMAAMATRTVLKRFSLDRYNTELVAEVSTTPRPRRSGR